MTGTNLESVKGGSSSLTGGICTCTVWLSSILMSVTAVVMVLQPQLPGGQTSVPTAKP